MRITVTRGHDGSVLVAGPHVSASFYRGERTLTGAVDRRGQHRAMSASEVLRFLGIERETLANVYDQVVLEDDKGLFGPIPAIEVFRHRRSVTRTTPLGLGVLKQLVNLNWRKS